MRNRIPSQPATLVSTARGIGFAVVAWVAVSAVWADESLPTLEPTIVTASRAPADLRSTPAAISVVDWKAQRRAEPALSIEEALRGVPGVFVQNSFNFAQDQRLSIRGFGTRAAFGIREIKVLVDGLPESSPDGQTQLDNLDLGTARRIEVLRGPSSALYGNASGGVVHILTDSGGAPAFIEARALSGSHGLRTFQMRTGGFHQDLDYFVSGNWTSLDGYRDHSQSEHQHLASKLDLALDDRSDLRVIFKLADSPWAQDPGGLTRAEVEENRRQARARNVDLDAGETVRQGKLGFLYRNELAHHHQLTVTQYALTREFANKLPILPRLGDGIVTFDRLGWGGGITYAGDGTLGLHANRLVAGVDVALQEDDRQRYANRSGSRGALGFDQRERVRSLGVFARNEFQLTPRLGLVTGARYDRLRFEVADRFRGDGNDSGTRTLEEPSFMAGLLFEPHPRLQLHTSLSTAFQTPTTTEFAKPDGGGGFNRELEPQTAQNAEIGLRGNLGDHLKVELAWFHLELEDALIPFTSESGRAYFRNAGASERDGLELALNWRLAPGLDWRSAYTYIDARYLDYPTDQGDFSGHREPGIPEQVLSSELAWQHDTGLFSSLDLHFIDAFNVDDANTAKNESATVLNARFGCEAHLGRGLFTPFVGVNNLLNKAYHAQTRLNAFGGRFYEPAPRRSAFAGLSCRVEF